MLANRLSETAARLAGCTLGEARNADCRRDGSCERCGWNADEKKRRAALPLENDGRGVWRKVVGGGRGGGQ